MTEFHLLRPYWLLAIIPIVLIWFQYRKLNFEETRFRKLIDPHLLEHLLVGQAVKSRVTPLNMLLIILFCTAIALSGPTYRKEASPFAGDDAGLMVLMKLGKSMSSKDLQPSRLERAKQKLWDLLELRKGKSTGLIVYSGSSHLVMPLTSDARVITTMIEDLTPDLMPKEGDDLAGAIQLGERMISQSGKSGSILIMADSVASSQLSLLEKMEPAVSFQFFSFNPTSSGIDPVLSRSAEVLGSRPVEVSLDPSDVELLARRAENSLTQITDSEKSERWRDDGYWFLPIIACCFLLWSRKGWVVR